MIGTSEINMAINQPPIGEDQSESAWKLEVTNQINNEETRINVLVARIEELERRLKAIE